MRPSILLLALLCTLGSRCFGQTDATAPESSAPDFEAQTLNLLNSGKQKEAETLLQGYVTDYPNDQRALFLQAALVRSRNQISDADPLFKQIVSMNPNTPAAECAGHLLNLDANREVAKEFAALLALVDKFPNDLIFRWMLAMEYRKYRKREEAVSQFSKILEKWNPGPGLVHQIYGNLLAELGRWDEALVERNKAVALEPAGWSYLALARNLTALKQYEEANQAYQKSVDLAPNETATWGFWSGNLLEQHNPDEAIAKARRAIEIDPRNDGAFWHWGMALDMKGNTSEAVEKVKMARTINPTDPIYDKSLSELESKQE
jgi:tetratricopeptide (TPR) repeat protein